MKRLILAYICMFGVGQSNAENIFFDLGEVLFRPSKAAVVNSIGLGTSLGYYAQLKKPQNAKRYLFECLAQLKERNSDAPVACYGDLPLPQYIEDWLSGSYESNQKLLNEVWQGIDTLDITESDKLFLSGVAGFMFNPQAFAETIRIIPEGMEILRACHNKRDAEGNKANKLYVISNWDAESFEHLHARPDMQEFWGMFDGVIISGQEKSIKPAKTIFDTARDRAKIDKGGIFIDDQPENIEAAWKFGFTGILCDSYEHVWQQLEELNIIEPRSFAQKNEGRIKAAVNLAIAIGGIYYAGPAIAKTAIGQWIATTRLAQLMSNFVGTLNNFSRIIG